MITDETAIANLLYRYAELIDAGDLEGAAQLFALARVKAGDDELQAHEVLEMWRRGIVIYPDGTPRTKHVITNPIIEIDADGKEASCRSYYTVMQQAEDGPLQAVICGRYHDKFRVFDGAWHFVYRDYSLHDLIGDMSHHSNRNRNPE